MTGRDSDFSILVVDDETEVLNALELLISSEGYAVSAASNAHEALNLLRSKEYQLIISDIMMPEMNGHELLETVKSINSEIIVVLMTGYSSVEGAVKAIKAGAQDYLIKPVNYDDVLIMIERNYQLFKKNRVADMQRQEIARHRTASIIGKSAAIKRVKKEISQVAEANISVLITGESGTGKELVARAIHNIGNRSNNMFVAINCASIPSDLLESELFGHEKGAFSGAVSRKYGLFEVADKGTILLDEIGEMQPELQAKLLRTIESGSFRRLGSTKEISSDFRVLSSTNKDLQEAITKKTFRSDLFFRLNQFHLDVPPLRERKSDIVDLVNYYSMSKGRDINFDNDLPDLLQMLKNYHWPGNVRELFNALERAFLLSNNKTILTEHFPQDIQQPSSKLNSSSDSSTLLADITDRHIIKIYNANGQNKSRTAKALGISVRSLYNKLMKIDM